MAASGFTPIQLYRTSTASAVPTAGNLADGELAINTADGKLFYKDSGGVVQTIANKNSTGTVTSVSWTGGIVSVATATTTPAFTIAGTSGGIPYFSSASTWATSAALAANAIVIGGGAGAAPATTTTGTGVLTALGVNVGSSGAFTTNNAANTFTAAQTFRAASAVRSEAASTQDAVVLAGRAGGTSSYAVTLTPTTLTASRTLTLPDATGVAVLDTATQTLTNKTLTNPTVTDYVETPVTANTGTAYTIDISTGTVQILTLTGNCTFTFPTATSGKSFMLLLKQDGTGGRTTTWPAAVKWPSGTAPTITSTASKLDKFVFTADGTNWYGSVAGQNY